MYLEDKIVPLPALVTNESLESKVNSEEEGEKGEYIAYIILLSIMVVYVTVGTCLERKGCGFGHETGVVILLGISIGAILDVTGEKVGTVFNPKVLFDFGLPFILYAAGYNMRRRRFFDDINNITMFGVLSTVVCFIILTMTTIAIFKWGWIYKFSEKDASGNW